MAEEMVEAYDNTTGNKLPNRVPKNFLRIFPTLSPTPSTRTKPSDDWTVKDLRAYAQDHGIDTTGAANKAELLEAISNPQQPTATDGADPATTGQNKES